MMLGHSRILTCPHCGQTKEIMSLLSGNTCGADFWSDNKCIAPMLPEISYVQKCPRCAMYFISSRQEAFFSKSSYSADCGSLSFAETKEAFAQLSQEKFRDMEEEAAVRMMLHHAYNDYYFRYGRHQAMAEADQKLFRENALWLIENFIEDDVMKAEFYREVGDLNKAEVVIEKVSAADDRMKSIVATIKAKIAKGETKVFLIDVTGRDKQKPSPLSFFRFCVACVEGLWDALRDALRSVWRLVVERRYDDIPEIPEGDSHGKEDPQLYPDIERLLQDIQESLEKVQQTDTADDHPPAGPKA